MGLEIPQEFWPITPIRTIPLPRTKATPITPLDDKSIGVSDLVDEIKENVITATQEQEQKEEDDDLCRTPKSEGQLIKTPLVCPPAPRKPRQIKRKSAVATQLFFHVPRDLNSVFTPLVSTSIKKIRAG